MRKLFTLQICRRLSSFPTDFKPGGVDLNQKIVYGGDLPVPATTKSFGRVLFERLTKKDRAERIIQVCTATGETQTTKKFVRRAVAVADRLKEEGIKKGDFILLVGNNTLNMNTALAGIFLMGAVPVPITSKTSLDEFKIIMRYIKPSYFGCDQKHLFSFRRALFRMHEYNPAKIFLLNQEKDPDDPLTECFEDFIRGKSKNVESFVPADVDDPNQDLALVMKALTDGALGRLVGITHLNLNTVVARYDTTEPETVSANVILMVQKVMWMSGIYSFIIATCFGSKLVVMREFDEEGFLKAIQDHKVTTSFLYASKAWQLYKHERIGRYDLSSFTYINIVDGVVPKFLLDGMREKIGLDVRMCWGVSELTGLALEPSSPEKEGSSGKLVLALYGKVVSGDGANVGPNEKGELCFKGPTLSKGYINNPKSTQQLLDKEGYLMSGHYGYYDEDGYFYIIDKIHFFIMYKNYKISPRELEGIIKSMDAVKDTAVCGIRHQTDGYFPIAFVVIQKGYKVTAEDIIRYVNDHVEDHKRLRGGVIFVPKILRAKESGVIRRKVFQKILDTYIVKHEVTLEDQPDTKKSSKGD